MTPRGSRQKQMGVALPDDIRAQVEAAAERAGHSIAEEIRQRLERTFQEDAIPAQTRVLMLEIKLLAGLIEIETGREWTSHPATTSVMKHAIDARLARMRGGDGNATFEPNELPPKADRLIVSDDSRTMATMLDIFVESKSADSKKAMDELLAEAIPALKLAAEREKKR
jgi:hypothetical protein